MRILLTAINAKYIHSNLAVYSLKASAGEFEEQVELAEFTVNHRTEVIFGEIYRKKPQLLLFSCYIWNRKEVLEIAGNIKKVLPDTVIWAGGPEVSWDAALFLQENPAFDGVMSGEGERTFYRLLRYYAGGLGTLEEIPGITYRVPGAVCEELADMAKTGQKAPGNIRQNPPEPPLRTLDHLPFVYRDLGQFENRILYYESSRGCPFSCSYCLSSLEKRVRFRSLELVQRELAFFLEHKVKQVKFVDRTFNCSHAHAMGIWRFLAEHDNGVTNFHFEISADLLTKEELELLSGMRPGLVQLEIGVQTVNEEALRAIQREAPFEKIAENVRRIAAYRNIHQHLDLIAGLPFEGYESFGRSFDAVYALRPQELQLGFLKVLRGSRMHRLAGEYGIVYREEPPYEVLRTRWISCDELLLLKEIEEMLEVYGNSHQFDRTVEALVEEYGRPFALYEALARFYRVREAGTGMRSYTRMQRLDLLREFVQETLRRKQAVENPDRVAGVDGRECSGEDAWGGENPDRVAGADGRVCSGEDAWDSREAEEGLRRAMLRYDRLLLQDLYLRENAKTRPAWAGDQEALKDRIIGFYKEEEQTRRYLPHYRGRTWKQLMKMTHLEYVGDGRWMLFDYARRDPLNYAAFVLEVPVPDGKDGLPG